MTKDIIKELRGLLKNDQEIIAAFSQRKIDRRIWLERVKKNTTRVKQILKQHGIVTKQYGENTYKAMLVLVLHSGDIPLMKQYLEMHRQNDSNVERKDEAMLVDKIKVISGGEQMYGTQYKVKNGSVAFLPIRDEKNVDKRRESLGLPSLEKYKRGIKQSLLCHRQNSTRK
ncbi:hypothetical protein IID26_00110 [Patescibacteria group bacterium]|nr:hypothetical protein [Patescibacteria group bacterium]